MKIKTASACVARHLLIGTALASALAAGAAPALASTNAQEAPQGIRFNIPAQDLGDALSQFARQSGQQLLYAPGLVAGKRSTALVGSFTPREGLMRLLSGSGIGFRLSPSGAYLLGNGVPAPVASGAAPAAGPQDAESEADIVVTGTNIRGVSDLAAPSIRINRREIERSSAQTTEELFQRIPQNFAGATPAAVYNESGSRLGQINQDRATGIDLRGIGPQSTLTLVNGTRRGGSADGRIVDVSAIPLSAIENVEIVTGGRSAIYGSDAVAGVVNIITRRDYQGFETQASYGLAGEGGERLQLSQIAGLRGSRGGFVVAYDYTHEQPLDLIDLGLLSTTVRPDGHTPVALQVQPESRRHSAFASGHFSITPWVEIFGDVLYTARTFDFESRDRWPMGAGDTFSQVHGDSDQLSFSLGLRADLGSNWTLNLSGARSSADNARTTFDHFEGFGVIADSTSQVDSRSRLTTGSLVLEGPLPSIGGITPRLAFGAEVRGEDLKYEVPNLPVLAYDRKVYSAFGELFVPLVTNGGPGMKRLELSLAGRYDHYSDFGDTFNPQVGLLWEPTDGLILSGAYSSAFRAPAPVELVTSTTVGVTRRVDPDLANRKPVITIGGTQPDLGPEEADTWSLTARYRPPTARWLNLSLSYFNIRYRNRIDTPAFGADESLILVRESRYPGLLNRTPTAAQIAATLALDSDGIISGSQFLALPNIVIFDNRLSNIASEDIDGIDFAATGTFDLGRSRLTLGLNGTYTLNHTRNLTPTSPTVQGIDELGKPVSFRMRGSVGFERGPVVAFLHANYTDGYLNPVSNPDTHVSALTTFDFSLQFRAEGIEGISPALRGLRFFLSVSDIFDHGPPRVSEDGNFGLRYDPANATAVGRYATFGLAYRW